MLCFSLELIINIIYSLNVLSAHHEFDSQSSHNCVNLLSKIHINYIACLFTFLKKSSDLFQSGQSATACHGGFLPGAATLGTTTASLLQWISCFLSSRSSFLLVYALLFGEAHVSVAL